MNVFPPKYLIRFNKFDWRLIEFGEFLKRIPALIKSREELGWSGFRGNLTKSKLALAEW